MPSLDLMNRVRRSPALYDTTVAVRDVYSFLKSTYAGSYSQHGEDLFIANFFRGRTGSYLDIGASHPFRISNTYLLYRAGWQGVTVEPIPRLGNLHRKWRPRDTLLPIAVARRAGTLRFFEMTPSVLSTLDEDVARAYISAGKAVLYRDYTIDVLPINDLFEQANRIAPIDFVSIDIEGLDVDILSDVDFSRFRPALICIEFNESEIRQKMRLLFERANYRILTELGCNLMAVPATD